MLPMNPFSAPRPQIKSVLQFPTVSEETPQSPNTLNQFIDQRLTGFHGKSRTVTLPNASSLGGSAISKNQDNTRCVIAGKDSLRIIRVVEPSEKHATASDHRTAIGHGGYRIEASRNQWTGSGLKIDSALTDVVWCHKTYDTKILTSARNGELIVWDVHRLGSMKYERRTKCHMRSINKLAYHPAMAPYCSSASSDGNLRLWDLRDLSKASYYINHPFPIRTAICLWDALNVVTGLDNGSMSRWDLRMGQKGLVERVPLAHSGHILSFDWSSEGDYGWLASAGQDRTVKIWQCGNDTSDSSHSTRKPTYVLHASYPIRRVIWRPGYETELAIASTAESSLGISSKLPSTLPEGFGGPIDKSHSNSSGASGSEFLSKKEIPTKPGDKVEIWDVRRPWIAKWTVNDSDCEGGVSDMTFVDSHALWVQHASGAFSQMDLRYSSRPIDDLTRTSLSWSPSGSLAFVSDNPDRWEKPYDDRQYSIPRTLDTEANEAQKKLGDPSVQLSSQNFGLILDTSEEDWDSFEFQARNYRIDGKSQSTLCEENSQVAYAANNYAFGNIWLLLKSLLQKMDALPHAVPTTLEDSTLLRSVSAPTAVPTLKKSPLKGSPSRSSSSDPPNSAMYRTFRHHTTSTSVHASSPLSPRHPPVSSKSSQLHSETSTAVADVHVSAAETKPQRRNTSRSTSFSAGKSSTSSRRRQEIGEGALGDSEDDTDIDSAQTSLLSPNKDGFSAQREHISSSSVISSRMLVNNPIGLEDIDDWAEDEKEDESTSPASSSEVDSSGSAASTRAARSSSNRRKAKSRGSQLSSHDSVANQNMNIARTNSQSSVLTITANIDQSIPSELPTKSSPTPHVPSMRSKSQNTQRTNRISSINDTPGREYEIDIDYEEDARFLEWNHDLIREREDEYKRSNWDALKIIFEEMAEQGELQMCAMLACIVPVQLGLGPWRVTQFIEAYIDLLSRQRLHSVAAYLRKYAPISEIRKSTQVQTTMYTSCANCRKPILQPVNGTRWMGFNYCIDCKRAVINCAICHLPVRSAAFVCAVCTHGGHRDCYYRYYMHRPMDELSMSSLETRGRKNTRTPTLSSSETTEGSVKSDDRMHMLDKSVIRISGHPCATGCGHHCWASSQKLVSG